MRKFLVIPLAVCAAIAFATQVRAQQPAAPPASPPPAPLGYGEAISLAQARAAAAAAEAEAQKNGWHMVIVVVGPTGELIYLQKADLAANASTNIAHAKARTSATFRAPTKTYMDRLANGENHLLTLPGAMLIAGGMPIIAGGKIIGAIGISGASPAQDHQTAQAGAGAVK